MFLILQLTIFVPFSTLTLIFKYGLKPIILLIFSSLLLIPVNLHAQEEEVVVVKNDSIVSFSPNPTRAILYSAIFPGLGQMYNRKYWKLPIVYGGFLGCAYAISWNGSTYNGYKQAYHDIQLYRDGTDTSAKSWQNYLPYSFKQDPDYVDTWVHSSSGENFANNLKRAKDFHRRNRDLSIIVTVGLYALCMIDAYVDAQLFEFDMSDDLSMKIDPVIFEPSPVQARSFGLQCSIWF
ncbi:MAG: hypothetical protein EZS26_000013 [Candidatus Ordinivivax streblomastigis]|uniref:DUF5683 domain-containing protein n=1 Tax=Candidatus Ordinivivax streblomastigis TaxID=2540710 RepID=A0A5M8P573_9BACT|nr:MAG: hypothetical protein EZS26_000013 [Candidatus Ordinivivax streblomastigis]